MRQLSGGNLVAVSNTVVEPSHQGSDDLRAGADEASLDLVDVHRLRRSLVRFGRAMRAVGARPDPAGLSRVDAFTLGVIDECGAVRGGRISELSGVGPSVISRQLAALKARGLVVRTKDPEDGRAELVELTDEGRALLEQATTAYVEGLTAALEGWARDRLHIAVDAIEELTAVLEESRRLR